MDFGNPQEVYNYFGLGIFPELATLFYSIAWLSGWIILFTVGYHIGQYGSGKSYTLNVKLILVGIFVSIQLIYLGEGQAVFRETLFNTPKELTYGDLGYQGPFSWYTALVISLVQLIGLYAYARGWMIWGFAGMKQHTSEGTFSKGLCHIIGGILAICIVRVILAFKHDFL